MELVVTLDGLLPSGHRRYVAAALAGLQGGPSRSEDPRRGDPAAVLPEFRDSGILLSREGTKGEGRTRCPWSGSRQGEVARGRLNGRVLEGHLRALGPGPVQVLAFGPDDKTVVRRDQTQIILAPVVVSQQ